MKRDMKGFTIVELMIVCAIVGILAAIAIPNYAQSRVIAEGNACESTMAQLESAVAMFRIDTGAYPASANDANLGAYLRTVETACPSGGNYIYTVATGTIACPNGH